MKILGIIPARYESARFPGKPLAMIAGKTMIQHVYEQCNRAANLSDVIVATDDIRIYNIVKEFGGNVMMTAENHLNGTSRCAEVIKHYAEFVLEPIDYIINIQGDEPLINPDQIDELATLFEDDTVEIATQVKPETDIELLKNRNIVKATLDIDNFAIDFQRIIQHSSFNIQYFFKHIGIYGFKSDVLQKLVQLEPTKNELELHLEQLRWLDNGYKIKAGITKHDSISVDTKKDLEKVIELLKEL